MAGSTNTSDTTIQTASIDERTGKLALTMAWWGLCSAMFYIFLGASLAIHFGAINAIIAMLIAVIVFGAISHVIVRYSIQTGISISHLSQLMFGAKGSLLATALLGLTTIYYAVFEGSVLAIATTKVFPNIGYTLACVIVVAYSAPLIIGSVQNFLNKLNAALLPLYLGGLLLLVLLTGQRYGFSSEWLNVGSKETSIAGIWQCFIAYMGVMVFMMVTVEYARFGRHKDQNYHSIVGFGIPFYLVAFFMNGIVGIFLVGTVDLAEVTEISVVDATLAILGGGIGLTFIWATQTRINTANYYVSVVNLQTLVETTTAFRAPRWVWAVILGIGILLTMLSTDIFSWMLLALEYQAVLITAWVGVALSFILGKKDSIELAAQETQNIPRISNTGLLAWFAGAGCGMVVMHIAAITTFASPVSFFVAVVIQLLGQRPSNAK